MPDASTSETMSPGLLKVVGRAKTEPEGRFHSLAHLLDVPALMRAYGRMRKDAAVGVDGVTKEQYGQDLERNLRDLHGRVQSGRYRASPSRRVHIPEAESPAAPGGTQPGRSLATPGAPPCGIAFALAVSYHHRQGGSARNTDPPCTAFHRSVAQQKTPLPSRGQQRGRNREDA